MTKELRTLLPEEKEFVRKLSELRKDRSDKNMPNFQSGRILEQIVGFNFAAITWDKDYNEPIKIYYEDKNLEPAACSSFFVLCDYLFLLEELESAGLIMVQSAMFEEERILYNRKKYKRKQFDNWEFKEIKNGFIIVDAKRKEDEWNINIVDYLERYVHLKVIYPKAALVSFVNNGFRTSEQVRHDEIIEEQQRIHKEEMNRLKKGLSITRCSAIVAGLTLLATIIFGVIRQCCHSKIELNDNNPISVVNKDTTSIQPNVVVNVYDVERVADTTVK